MRIIIAGGGTGGHVFPAISIADEIADRKSGDEILFVGTKTGMENGLVQKNGYQIRHISSKGFVGRGLFKTLIAFFYAFKGLIESVSVIWSFKPDVVLGVGGYVSGPLLLGAYLSRKPTAICEQNTVPGVTNRILGKIVDKVFTSYDSSVQYFPFNKVRITGNPIRKDILRAEITPDKNGPVSILIFGGSQGAYSLNRAVPEAFSKLNHTAVSITHQTGKKDLDHVKSLYEKNGIDAEVTAFIDNMAQAYAKADLVIGRAGAGTIAEITALGLPSVLVPFPHAAHNHQFENARILEERGAAVLITDEEATPEKLADTLTSLLTGDKLITMAQNTKKLGKPDAAKEIVEELYIMAGDK